LPHQSLTPLGVISFHARPLIGLLARRLPRRSGTTSFKDDTAQHQKILPARPGPLSTVPPTRIRFLESLVQEHLISSSVRSRTYSEHTKGFSVRCLSAHIPEQGGKAAPLYLQASAPTLSEAFSTTTLDGGAAGFVLAMLPKGDAPIFWVQDALSEKEAGRPYLPGLRLGRPMIHLTLNRPADVLSAMEEGLRCASLGAVIGEIWGDPPALDFTATRRLAVRAEATKLPCWLMRRAATPNLSAARNRWRIASLPSEAHPHDPQAPGNPRWQAELFRSRQAQPGTWVATYDRAADRVDFSAPFRDGAVAERDGTSGRRAAG
jgi:protein ImuA